MRKMQSHGNPQDQEVEAANPQALMRVVDREPEAVLHALHT